MWFLTCKPLRYVDFLGSISACQWSGDVEVDPVAVRLVGLAQVRDDRLVNVHPVPFFYFTHHREDIQAKFF